MVKYERFRTDTLGNILELIFAQVEFSSVKDWAIQDDKTIYVEIHVDFANFDLLLDLLDHMRVLGFHYDDDKEEKEIYRIWFKKV